MCVFATITDDPAEKYGDAIFSSIGIIIYTISWSLLLERNGIVVTDEKIEIEIYDGFGFWKKRSLELLWENIEDIRIKRTSSELGGKIKAIIIYLKPNVETKKKKYVILFDSSDAIKGEKIYFFIKEKISCEMKNKIDPPKTQNNSFLV